MSIDKNVTTNHCFCCHISSEPTETSWEEVISVEHSTDGLSKTVVGYGYCGECNADSGPCCQWRAALTDDEQNELGMDSCSTQFTCNAMGAIASSKLAS
jgi:hypothetical protein